MKQQEILISPFTENIKIVFNNGEYFIMTEKQVQEALNKWLDNYNANKIQINEQ